MGAAIGAMIEVDVKHVAPVQANRVGHGGWLHLS
jgi:hypothetical protein